MGNSAKLVKKFRGYQVVNDEDYRNGNLKLVHSSRTRLSKLGNFHAKQIESTPKLVKKEPKVEKVEFAPDKDLWTLKEIMNSTLGGIYFLIGRLIPGEAITFLTGTNDVGKSLFYLFVCLAIIQGLSTVFGLKLKTNHKHVLIVSTEDSVRSVKERITKMLKGTKLGDSIFDRLLVLTAYVDIPERINEILMDQPCDLVIVDAFADVFDGNMNSSNDVRRYLNKYDEIIRHHKCSIMFVHHVGKGNSTMGPNKLKVLGSTGIVDKARQVIEINISGKDSLIREIMITKGNDNSQEEKKRPYLYLRLNPESLTFEPEDKKKVEKLGSDTNKTDSSQQIISKAKPGRKTDTKLKCLAFKLKDQGMKQSEIAERVGRSEGTISRWLSGPRPICDENDLYQEVLSK